MGIGISLTEISLVIKLGESTLQKDMIIEFKFSLIIRNI